MDFSNSTLNLTDNFLTIRDKIRNSIPFWEQFNLSLPGRINITKSLLVSLLNHLGCFLQPEKECLHSIQLLLDKFAKGTLNIAANRICLPVVGGGLGMINLEDFLTSQQATWLFRCVNSCRDNWRADVIELSNGNPFTINANFICKLRHPVLFCLASSFLKLRINYDRCNENYLHSSVMYHPIFYRDRGDKNVLTFDFLGVTITSQKIICARLTLQECFGQNGILSYPEFALTTGLNLSLAGFNLLKKALQLFLTRINVDRISDGSAKSINNCFCLLKKPSRTCRRILSKYRNKSFELSTLTSTNTFFRLTNLVYDTDLNFCNNISAWNLSYLSNRTRTFLFKFYYNYLGLNVRTSHFAANQSRGCFFCTHAGIIPTPDEDFAHLFRDCPTTKNWHSAFLLEFFRHPVDTLQSESLFWFLGILSPASANFNIIVFLSALLFQYCIWEEKLRKRRPSYLTIKTLFIELFKTVILSRRKLIICCEKLNLPLCRLICPAVHRVPALPVPAQPVPAQLIPVPPLRP